MSTYPYSEVFVDGGLQIPHKFMQFAHRNRSHASPGGFQTSWGCHDIKKSAKPQDRDRLLRAHGCGSLSRVQEVEDDLQRVARQTIGKMQEIIGVIDLGSQTDVPVVLKMKERKTIESQIALGITNYILHAVAKNAARTTLAGNVWEYARRSLLKRPPSVDIVWFKKQAWVWSDLANCSIGDSNGLHSCTTWQVLETDTFDQVTLSNASAETVIDTLHQLEELLPSSSKLSALLAQRVALYPSVGFDAAGTLDDATRPCETVTSQCKVHPQCGRVAAQMLVYPFSANRIYASTARAKVGTWLKSSFKPGAFDEHGYHSFCHAPGGAYCWTYTDCLHEMLKWLCSQTETHDCCPGQEAAVECGHDVNSPDCEVCRGSD